MSQFIAVLVEHACSKCDEKAIEEPRESSFLNSFGSGLEVRAASGCHSSCSLCLSDLTLFLSRPDSVNNITYHADLTAPTVNLYSSVFGLHVVALCAGFNA